MVTSNFRDGDVTNQMWYFYPQVDNLETFRAFLSIQILFYVSLSAVL